MTRAVNASALRYAWRRARHGWQSRGALLLVAALIVAVGAAGAVGLFTERVRGALVERSGDALGADALLRSRSALPDTLVANARDLGLETARITSMPSVVFNAADASSLAAVKAVSRNYPLRSGLRIADRPFAEDRVAGAPAAGTIYVDSRLYSALELAPGALVQVGATTLTVAAVITFEPDRTGGFADLGPRLMMAAEDLDAAGLTGPGARVQHALQLAGSAEALARMEAAAEAAGVSYLRPRDARQELGAALDRAGVFLDLAVVCALILAAAAAMIASDTFGRSLRDEAALLRALGASRRFIVRALLALLLTLGAAGIALGVAVAFGAQAVIAWTAGALVGGELPAPPAAPALRAALLGLLLLVGFALPSVLAVRHASPMRVFQRSADTPDAGAWSVRIVAGVALVALVGLQARSLTLGVAVIGGAAVAALVLFVAARTLLRAFDGIRHSGAAGMAWRLGLANLARRRRSAGGLAAALGLVLLALMLMAIVRTEMLSQWRDSLPAGTPNVFLINVQAEQRAPLQALLAERGLVDIQLWPMARGRLVGLNDEAVVADDFDDPETQRWINRDFNMSWSAELPDSNTLIDGQWWTADQADEALLSADDYAVERLDLKIGDRLTLRFADQDITFRVHNLRRVAWDSFSPNFFLMTTPGALDDGRVPVSWLTSFHVAEGQGALLRTVIERFPNVTPIDIEALLAQVRAIIDRVVQAVAFLLAFALAAGLLVLLAAIETSRAEREREVALLRTLGARSRFVAQALLVEYGTLGAASGLLAAGVAQLVAARLAADVFEMPFALPWWPWLVGPVGGAVLVGTMGWLALRGITRIPPDRVLRLQAAQ